MTVHRMDQASVVVEDRAAAVTFFVELEGEATVEGEWSTGSSGDGIIIGLIEDLR